MNISKVLEMLGVDKIDESKQTEIKDTLKTIIEAKATEIAKESSAKLIAEQRQQLAEEFETKFTTYKDDVTSKFSNFVDSILDEELVIPEKIQRYARLGELYEDLINQFKVRLAVDEGVLSDEVKGMLKEAKTEIVSLRKEVNELTGKKLELERDAKDLATHIYLRKKADGLTESQKTTVFDLLEGADKETIDKKFDVIVESLKPVEETKIDETTTVITEQSKGVTEVVITETTTDTKTTLDPLMEQWVKSLKENKIV